MERLTKYAIPKMGRGFPTKKYPCFSNSIVKNDCPVMFCHKAEKCDSIKNRKCPYLQVMDKLSAYEDTGLEPEEIDSVFIHGVIEENRRLKELAQAEKDGRLVVLPCKVGDLVYALWGVQTVYKYVIYYAEIKEIYISVRNCRMTITYKIEPIEYRGRQKEYRIEDFGKTVFLTREEAEAELKKREEEDNAAD